MNQTKILFPQPYIAYVVLKQTFNVDSDLVELKQCVNAAYAHAIETSMKFYFIFNTTHVNYASPFILKNFAVWMRDNSEMHTKFLIKSYLIIPNQIAKLAFATILTFYRPTRPYVVVLSSDEANDLVAVDSTYQSFEFYK